MAQRKFAIAYNRFNRILNTILLMRPGSSGVTVGDDHIDVHMGWAFDGRIPRSQITSVGPGKKPRFAGWGVHGWRGTWTVNGSDRGMVKVTIEPPTHVRTLVFAIKLRTLFVSLEDPDGFIAELNR